MTELASHLLLQSVFQDMQRKGEIRLSAPASGDQLQPVGALLAARVSELISGEVIVNETMDSMVRVSE